MYVNTFTAEDTNLSLSLLTNFLCTLSKIGMKTLTIMCHCQVRQKADFVKSAMTVPLASTMVCGLVKDARPSSSEVYKVGTQHMITEVVF